MLTCHSEAQPKNLKRYDFFKCHRRDSSLRSEWQPCK